MGTRHTETVNRDGPLLQLQGLRHRRPGAARAVLNGVDLSVQAGEVYAVLGPSGSGKSTLLRAVAGLEDIDAGRIEAPARPGDTVMVPQRPALLPWRTVRENVALGASFAATRARVLPERVDALLSALELEDLAERLPATLSGGQAQRVAIGRALAAGPRLLLLDEPFSALDPALRGSLRSWLRGLVRELRLTVLLVTHDPGDAVELADRVGFFSAIGNFSGEWRAGHPELRRHLAERFADAEPAAGARERQR